MPERIQKIIAAHGLMSRRAAEAAIVAGRVTVNGRVALLGESADASTDTVEVDREPLRVKPDMVYIMINKPRGVLSTMSDERGRPTVASLVASVGKRVLPVGRLDMNSEGLLLMTNNLELINKITHPKHQIGKTYHVWTAMPPEMTVDEAVAAMSRPMEIEGYVISPAVISCVTHKDDRLVLSVVIYEGRKRQVRHMCAQCGLRVLRLVRVEEGGLKLGSLKSGSWRHLTPDEVKTLTMPHAVDHNRIY